MLPPRLLAQIRRVAQELPPSMLESVMTVISACQKQPSDACKGQLLQKLPHTRWRQTVTNLLEVWQLEAPKTSGEAIATALATAAHCESAAKSDLSLEIVWTGPDGSGIPVRRTEQVLLQLIREAQHSLTIVSFAVYKVPEIAQTLVAAMNRGVYVTIIAETPEETSDPVPFGIEAGLGAEVAKRAQIYVWDRAKRPRDENGRCGSLHVKCAIADHHHLFVTSANLTGYALSLNMEMGVLVHSRELAGQMADHLEQLKRSGVLSSE